MFHGARFDEILGVMNHVARENPQAGCWTRNRDQLMCEGIMPGGPSIRLRHIYNGNGLCSASITGKGWLFSLTVTRQRPRTMEESVWSEMGAIVLAPPTAIRWVVPSYPRGDEQTIKRMCFHDGKLASPDEFQKEMTIVRMFSSEWGL